MEEKNYSYSEMAAKWWANKVRTSTTDFVRGLVPFEALLESEIRKNTSLKGHMNISTYHCRNKLLEEVAAKSHLSANIPIGYEMKILFDQVYIYNSKGQLVESF